MKIQRDIALVLALLLIPLACLGPVALAQEQTEIEEIVVIGELTRSAVRAHIIQVEDDIYEFYNANNGDKDFDIICADVVRTGTRLPQRVCEPVFLTKQRQRSNRDWQDERLSEQALMHLVSDEYEELNAIYVRLMTEYPSLAEAFAVLADLKARLEELGG